MPRAFWLCERRTRCNRRIKDSRCLIQSGALAGLFGTVVGFEPPERVLVHIERLPSVFVRIASENVALVASFN